MRRNMIVAVLAVAATLTLFDVTVAGGADHHATVKIFASLAPNRIANVAVTPGSFGLGDRIVFSDDLFASRGGRRVGLDGGECVVVRVENAASASGVAQCRTTFSLPSGHIVVAELNTMTHGSFTGTKVGAITGGTGRYRDVRGQAKVKFLSDDAVDVTFILDR